jgi:hypothetical protein
VSDSNETTLSETHHSLTFLCSERYELGSRARTDATFDALLSQCVAQGPTECPLARHAATAAELQAKIYAMIDAARANPIALPLEHARYDTTIVRGTVVDYSTLKTMDFLSLYEASTQTQMLAGLDGAFASQLDSEVCLGISCSDSTRDPMTRSSCWTG